MILSWFFFKFEDFWWKFSSGFPCLIFLKFFLTIFSIFSLSQSLSSVVSLTLFYFVSFSFNLFYFPYFSFTLFYFLPFCISLPLFLSPSHYLSRYLSKTLLSKPTSSPTPHQNNSGYWHFQDTLIFSIFPSNFPQINKTRKFSFCCREQKFFFFFFFLFIHMAASIFIAAKDMLFLLVLNGKMHSKNKWMLAGIGNKKIKSLIVHYFLIGFEPWNSKLHHFNVENNNSLTSNMNHYYANFP